jgi:AraC family transcriptional activator of pobA
MLEFLEQPATLVLEPAKRGETDLWLLGAMLLREFGRSAKGRQSALRGLLGALLANAMRLAQPGALISPTATPPDHELVARFRQHVERRFREHVGIANYAADMKTSESRLRRACLAVAGQSPVELVHLRLLVEAERELRYTSMSVTQIAYHLGFDDPAYFSRFFAQRMGVSPRAFRAAHGLETGNADPH